MDKIPYHTSTRIRLLREASDKWASGTGVVWDIAACWHLPFGDMEGGIDDVDIRIGKKLRRYFNQLDRRIFKAQHKRGHRVKRFITLEHAESVGWHVHGFLATPSHIDQQDFMEDVRQVWQRCVRYDRIGLPRTRLAWCEPIVNRYPQYTTKHSFGPLQGAKGTIDTQNAYFGELPN